MTTPEPRRESWEEAIDLPGDLIRKLFKLAEEAKDPQSMYVKLVELETDIQRYGVECYRVGYTVGQGHQLQADIEWYSEHPEDL